ncbi:cutinase family protein [uncultured Williamsia sp.]|uniref:cutinase family protein n=1 Tax=uncultured Williamsia sp. TaxID=259311 RepID=UPI00261C3511|nr:cutinase family protein [uncultured Williamsia sp.]
MTTRWGTGVGAVIAAVVVAASGLIATGGTAGAVTPTSGCPATVVIPARGSGDPAVAPQQYGAGRSDGYEGPLLSRLLTATYRDDRSIAAVPVVTTGPGYRAVSVPEGTANHSFGASIASGVAAVIARYDAAAAAGGPGCRPKAVLIGYSQGAAVVRAAAVVLAPRRVVSAVMLFGDPQQRPSAPGVVGAGSTGSGVWRDPAVALASGVSTVGIETYYQLPGLQRWSLCHDRDPVCDFGPDADFAGDPHLTYLQPNQQFVPAAGQAASSQTELQMAVATLRGFIATATRR